MFVIINEQSLSVAISPLPNPRTPDPSPSVIARSPFNCLSTSGHFSLTIKRKQNGTRWGGILAFIPEMTYVWGSIQLQYRTSHPDLVCLSQQFIRVMSEFVLLLSLSVVNKPCLGDSLLSDILEYSPKPWSHFAVSYKQLHNPEVNFLPCFVSPHLLMTPWGNATDHQNYASALRLCCGHSSSVFRSLLLCIEPTLT